MHRRKETKPRKSNQGAWWLKSSKDDKSSRVSTSPFTDSMSDFLQNEKLCETKEVDITNILDEINRLAAESPGLKADIEDIGSGERTIEDIMREAEKLSQTSSKNIDELTSSRSSLRSRSTPAVTPRSNKSTPKSPRSYSQEGVSYKSDFDESSKVLNSDNFKEPPVANDTNGNQNKVEVNANQIVSALVVKESNIFEDLRAEVQQKNVFLEEYEKDNRRLRLALKVTKEELDEAKLNIQNKSLQSNQQVDKSLQLELDKALENLKDLQEHNTALQVQYDSLNKSHQELKEHSDRLVSTNGDLERKLIESETVIMRLRNELQTLRDKYSNLLESEQNFKKSIEHEKELNRNLKLQADKDANMIQDLNRQVREMDRILKRKKPDSVSALILAANQSPDSEGRKLLEDRIKELEEEANERDTHSTKLFVDIQEKFNKMKEKYESHIEDLEKHVLDLKYQLISVEQADASTQTFLDTNRNVDYVNVGVQTITNKIPKRIISKPARDETQLLNTIRNLTQEISEKESIIIKLEKEMDELFKTNRRLQKERETALKSHVRNSKTYNPNEYRLEYDLPSDIENMNTLIGVAKDEKEALKLQLSRLEEDYQMLKVKRLQDLNTLQEAHEQELTNYMGKMSPLREQLEVQQVTIKKLQQHLATAREQVAVLTVERDHLETILKGLRHLEQECQNEEGNHAGSDYTGLQRRIAQLERRYEERELRLRAIVQGLAQKQTTNTARNCEQCMIRQQQLCGYKAELDQVLSTLRNCTNL